MSVFNSERTFGIELEVTTRVSQRLLQDAINAEFQASGINMTAQAQGYNHRDQAIWKIVSDATVSGWEVVSPPMKGLEAKAQIEAVCKALNLLGVTVDTTTGFHVHHDSRDLSGQAIGSAFAIYANNHDVIDMMLAPSRRNTRWASKFTAESLVNNSNKNKFKGDERMTAVSKISRYLGTRYTSVNIQAVYDHGTIEFRQHQGTTDVAKIWNWILFTQSIIEAGKEATQFPKKSKVGAKGAFNNLYGKLRVSANYNNNNPDSKIYVEALKFMNKRFRHFCQASGVSPITMSAEPTDFEIANNYGW